MKYRNSLLSGAFCTGLLVLSACGTPQQIAYFQDFNQNPDTLINLKSAVITAKPTDKLYIGVKSKDPQISQLFNLTGTASTSTVAKDAYYYTVDSKGNIDFPILGELTVTGMTRSQIAALIKQRLKEENLVNDPVVTVEFINLSFSILGEVKTPGKYSISKDYITLLEAISMAGDLTIYGKRDAIFVIREEKGERVTHWVDLRSYDLFKSPVYYLKQNDVVYVQPNKVRAGQSTLNENSVKSVGLWISIGSFLTSLGVLLFK